VRDELEALRKPDLSEDDEKERWTRIKRLAPTFIDSGQPIIETVVTATIKAHLGLPPT
jgi:hypothetical protein